MQLDDYIFHSEDSGVLYQGDCLDVMAAMEPESVDTVLTDPPYGLRFMQRNWDHGVPGIPFWTAALRVAKPGAMLMAFGGTRTHHRLMVAIEDAGWEIRDCLMWLYGSGFPKSLDISKAIDKAAGAERSVIGKKPDIAGYTAFPHDDDNWQHDKERAMEITAPATPAAQLWDGWGTALKPAWEPIILAMKPLDGTFAHNALEHGVAGLHIDGGRIETNWKTDPTRRGWQGSRRPNKGPFNSGDTQSPTIPKCGPENAKNRYPANLILDEESAAALDQQTRDGRAGKPTGTGALREGHYEKKHQFGTDGGIRHRYDDLLVTGASRFFYCAKASRAERNRGLEDFYWDMREKTPVKITEAEWMLLDEKERGTGNIHNTVKPLKLMEYLCKLTATPTGGVILDPFAGSGTTGIAAKHTGRKYILIEKESESCEIAAARLKAEKPEDQLQLVGT